MRVIKIVLQVVFIILLVGCKADTEGSKEEEQASYMNEDVPIEKGKYYEIFDITKYGKSQYQYFIFSESGDVLSFSTVKRCKPKIIFENEIVKITVPTGTGIITCKYVDPNRGLTTNEIWNPIVDSKNLVVVYDPNTSEVIVSGLFDRVEKGRLKINLQGPPSMYSTNISGKFSADEKFVYLTYINTDGMEVKETIELSN